ncbi:MAG: sugar ABC transporter ATP-binding protein [Bifidobacteriaceae bacterium]|jgi:ABC-type sugar transport system ATPase subunit|nr:sugar ABC transporter ATP-binding protein [Bifidobacteriaceae bacterium]
MADVNAPVGARPPAGAGRFGLRDLTVEFGATRAVNKVTLEIQPGEIVGLLGHNGAGKSTIVNVASGALAWTSGQIRIDGAPIPRGSSPRSIAELGVTVIHQEPALAGNLSVLTNLFLGRRRSGALTARRQRAQAALREVGGESIPLDVPVSTLSLGQRQLVDLARGALSGEIRVLMLDEPTAALGVAETASLHALIRSYAKKDAAVVYISHRLVDILDVCQRIVVLESGEVVLDRSAAGLSLAELSQALAPGVVHQELVGTARAEEVVRVDLPGGRIDARAGEVVGLFGMAGGEQLTVLESLFGVGPKLPTWLDGQPHTPKRPGDALRRGIFMVPPDRDRDGLLADFSGKTNVMLPWLRGSKSAWWFDRRTGASIYQNSREVLNVQGPGGEVPVTTFSGGNRQKHLLARWMFPAKPRLLLLGQPTQGVDVGAKVDIVRAVRLLAADGVCVLVASSENDEIASMCDRAYVLRDGRVAPVERGPEMATALLDALLQLSGPSGDRPRPVETN